MSRAGSRGQLSRPARRTDHDTRSRCRGAVARRVRAAAVDHDDLDTGRARTFDGSDDLIRFVQSWDHHRERHRPTIATSH